MMKLVAEVKTEEVFDYLDDLDIDLCLRRTENYRATMMFVGESGKPVVEIFDDKNNIAWYIEINTRKVARCKNGKWSKFYDVDTLDEIKPTERLV